MDTYCRGIWGKDDAYPDQFKLNGDTLTYKGFDSMCDFEVGDAAACLQAYHADVEWEEGDVNYEFFVVFGNGNRSWGYLVPDLPSLLMLVKEVTPLIEGTQRKEMHEIRLEEHGWHARGVDDVRTRQRECCH